MLDKAAAAVPSRDAMPDRPCRMVGRFVGKGSSFALRERCGTEIWLEMDRIPLHLIDEDVEITGRRYGPSLVWVEAIGPVPGLS